MHLHYAICKTTHTHTHTQTHTDARACHEQQDVTVFVHTDGEVTANRPNIIIKNKKEKTCMLIDVAIPMDRSVQKEGEKS